MVKESVGYLNHMIILIEAKPKQNKKTIKFNIHFLSLGIRCCHLIFF